MMRDGIIKLIGREEGETDLDLLKRLANVIDVGRDAEEFANRWFNFRTEANRIVPLPPMSDKTGGFADVLDVLKALASKSVGDNATKAPAVPFDIQKFHSLLVEMTFYFEASSLVGEDAKEDVHVLYNGKPLNETLKWNTVKDVDDALRTLRFEVDILLADAATAHVLQELASKR